MGSGLEPEPIYHGDVHITMVKKALTGGSECRKCEEASEYLRSRGLWGRVNEVIWAVEDDPDSPGMELGRRHGVDRVPFFVIRDDQGETVCTSVLQLVRERLGTNVAVTEEIQAIDVDDIGGI
jgi:hypothetical protein